jgi:predicted DNA-binding protein
LVVCGYFRGIQKGFTGRTTSRRLIIMSDQTRTISSGQYGQVKTLAVRISEDLRAQLDIIAQLNDRTVTDEIRYAIEGWIEKSKADPTVLQRAELVRAEIERDAQVKSNAIDAIFSKPDSKSESKPRPNTAPRTQATDKPPAS